MYRTFDLRVPAVVKKRHVGFQFSNGAKVVIVEDPACTLSVAAVTMFVGSNQDPPQFPGLAHFCEHMLFMGTAAYPQEDAFDNFVSQHGGHTNAWTSSMSTTYYFTIANEHFQEGVERFGQFFAAPLFNEFAVRREVEAVHSEDEKNHASDYWCWDEIMRELSDKRHVYASYGNGNRHTLLPSIDSGSECLSALRTALISFYETNYTADAFAMVLYTNSTAETLLPSIQELIAQLRPSSSSSVPLHIDPGRRVIRLNSFIPVQGDGRPTRCAPFASATMESAVIIKTKKKIRSVRFVFPFASPLATRAEEPAGYASHVIGHECETSLLGRLKHQGWATALTAGEASPLDDDDSYFYIDVSLTVVGWEKIESVCDCIFGAIGLLNRKAQSNGGKADTETLSCMVEEQLLHFEMTEMSRGTDHCANLSSSLHDAERTTGDLREAYCFSPRFDAERSAQFVEKYLLPSNCFMVVMWDGFPTAFDDSNSTVESDEDEENSDEGSEPGEAEENSDSMLRRLPSWLQLPCSRQTQFHKAKFATVSVPQELLTRWEQLRTGNSDVRVGDEVLQVISQLALPPPNPFLATDFSVFPAVNGTSLEAVPQVRKHEFGTLFVRPSLEDFQLPKVAIQGQWHSPVAYTTPLNRFFTRVMCSICEHNCTELLYLGSLASITNWITPSQTGLRWALEGPSEKLPSFFQSLAKHCVDAAALVGSKELFLTYVDSELRKLQSIALRQPHEIASDRLQWMTTELHYNEEEIRLAAAGCKYEQYLEFVKSYTSCLFYSMVIVGNVLSVEQAARDFAEPLEALLVKLSITSARDDMVIRNQPHASAVILSRQHVGGPAPVFVFTMKSPHPADDLNSSAVVDLTIGVETPLLRICAEVLVKLLSSKFFNALRTVEALGYIVATQLVRTNGRLGLRFLSQSAKEGATAPYLFSRTVAFIEAVETQWEKVICTPHNLRSVLEALLKSREESLKNLAGVAQETNDLIFHAEQFDRRQNDIRVLRKSLAENEDDGEKVTTGVITTIFQRFVSNSSNTRTAIVVAVKSNSAQANNELDWDQISCPEATTWRLPPMLPSTPQMRSDDDQDRLELPDFRGECLLQGVPMHHVQSLRLWRRDVLRLAEGETVDGWAGVSACVTRPHRID